jgi:hypothetical protein
MRILFIIFTFLYIETSAQTPTDSIIPTFGGVTDGKLTMDIINNTDSVVLFFNKASLVNSKVLSFSVHPTILGSDIWSFNSSNKITEGQRELINQVQLLWPFYIEQIRVKINNDTLFLKKIIKIEIDGPKACLFDFTNPWWTPTTIYLNNDSLSPRKTNDIILSNCPITTKKIFLLNDFLLVSNSNSYICPKIIKYSCTIHRTSGQDTTFNIVGDLISKSLKMYIKKCKNIDYIKFDNIEAQYKNGEIIKVGNLHLTIL